MTELKEMGRRIQDAIKKKGLKQKFVAEQIGISEDSIGNYITGRREISAENLEKIADLTGVTVQFLLTGTDAVLSEKEQRIVESIKEPIIPIYRAGQQLKPKFQFSQQQLLEIIKLKGTNPFLYSILESVMELNNKLADKLEAMEKQQNKSMQEE